MVATAASSASRSASRRSWAPRGRVERGRRRMIAGRPAFVHRTEAGWRRTMLGAAAGRGPWILLALALALGGCATGPAYPLLSPIAAAGSFGYSEAAQGSDRVSVNYLTPARLATSFPGPHAGEANAARTLGFDMAVWRAAQLA